MKKYLVVYNSYVGRYYNGKSTIVYDTYEEMIKSLKENKNSLSLKPKSIYVISKELDMTKIESEMK